MPNSFALFVLDPNTEQQRLFGLYEGCFYLCRKVYSNSIAQRVKIQIALMATSRSRENFTKQWKIRSWSKASYVLLLGYFKDNQLQAKTFYISTALTGAKTLAGNFSIAKVATIGDLRLAVHTARATKHVYA